LTPASNDTVHIDLGIPELREKGWTLTRIAAHYGVSERELGRWVQSGRLNPKNPVPREWAEALPPRPLALDYEQTLVVNDAQYPHHDSALWEATCRIARDAEVDRIVWAGDMLDFEQLSSFTFDVYKTQRAQDDVEGFHRDLREPLIKSIGYKPEEIWLDGNHEHRYSRYVQKHSALGESNAIEFMGIGNMKTYIPYGTRIGYWLTPSLVVVHGWSTAKNSAQRHLMDMGASVIHGHTHRLSSFHMQTSREHMVAYEVGHMSDPSQVPGFHGEGLPDWHQVAGTLVQTSRTGESFNVEVLEVVGRNHDRVFCNGRVYDIER